MLVYIGNARLEQLSHPFLGEPNGLLFHTDFDPSLTVFRLVQQEFA
jgi:hypothetical protein